jgi:hypothetical protein
VQYHSNSEKVAQLQWLHHASYLVTRCGIQQIAHFERMSSWREMLYSGD